MAQDEFPSDTIKIMVYNKIARQLKPPTWSMYILQTKLLRTKKYLFKFFCLNIDMYDLFLSPF